MKFVQFDAGSIRKLGGLALLGTLAIAMTSVACSRNSKPPVSSSQVNSPVARPATLQTVAQTVSEPVAVSASKETSAAVKPPSSQLIQYRSRDYGVSFMYPWQYSFINAKSIADESSLQPKSDGHDGQFTLARVDVPRGFFPDTDLESGYFTLSLNQNLSEQDCQSTLGAKDGQLQTATVNGTDFRWVETETGGHGSGAVVRNYVAFASGTCYEIEMGVKTRNEQGLAREVNADQVLRRLDRILKTVKITPATQNIAEPPTKTATDVSSDTDETE
jgi:hypothetical protein